MQNETWAMESMVAWTERKNRTRRPSAWMGTEKGSISCVAGANDNVGTGQVELDRKRRLRTARLPWDWAGRCWAEWC